MPELPEVETIRRDLARVIVNQPIIKVEVRHAKIIASNPRTFSGQLKNQVFYSLKRRGKLLYFEVKPDHQYLLIHLKMTGQLIHVKRNQVIAGGHSAPSMQTYPNKHTHIIFHLQDKSTLYFNDLRKFGYLKLVNDQQLARILDNYGIEPGSGNFSLKRFTAIIKSSRAPLKNILLNQPKIAGLGNIYVDEACWHAKIRPTRRAYKLTHAEIRRLHHSIEHIIKVATEHRGTTFNDYVDAHGRQGGYANRLKSYGRAGKTCLRCRRATIKKTKINGRGTTYCPRCQPA